MQVDYFECENCGSKDFKRLYNFSLRFHKVNFSDELIYDRKTSEVYQCMGCEKRFSPMEIEEGLDEIKKERRKKTPQTREG